MGEGGSAGSQALPALQHLKFHRNKRMTPCVHWCRLGMARVTVSTLLLLITSLSDALVVVRGILCRAAKAPSPCSSSRLCALITGSLKAFHLGPAACVPDHPVMPVDAVTSSHTLAPGPSWSLYCHMIAGSERCRPRGWPCPQRSSGGLARWAVHARISLPQLCPHWPLSAAIMLTKSSHSPKVGRPAMRSHHCTRRLEQGHSFRQAGVQEHHAAKPRGSPAAQCKAQPWRSAQ